MLGRLLTWKALASITIFLIFLLEWKRFNQMMLQQAPKDLFEDSSLLRESSLLNGDWHKGRQLLKKLSRSSNGGLSLALASTTSASEQETFIQQKSLLEENDDKSFGESVSLAHWMDERQKVYDARQRRVDAICHRFNVSTVSSSDAMEDLINLSVHNDSATGRYVERIKTDQFLLSRPNQLMGCLINKVASSSMMRMYLTLQGLDNKKIESPHGYRLKFVPENEKELKFSQKHFFKFMLVRHPMERLVSCYFDKMVNGTHKSLKGFRKFVKLRAEKIRQERKDKLHRFGGSVYNPTFKDDRPIGSYPKSNPWSGYSGNQKPIQPNSHKRPKRAVSTPNTKTSTRSSKSSSSKSTTVTNSNSANRNKTEEPMVIPTLDDFF